MADFNIAYKLTSNIEGGYSNHRNDRGGETWKGIARKSWPNWEGWRIIDEMKVVVGFPSNLKGNSALQRCVESFYRLEFWDSMLLSQVENQLIANEAYDTAVNMSTVVSGIFLQRVLNVSNVNGKFYPDLKIDGVVGEKTIKALNSHPYPMHVLKALNCLQGARYITICEANPSQEVFFNGWIKRINEYAN